jgi:hypothetical protein
MDLSLIVKDINTKLAGEMLSYAELRVFLDSAIDEINARLDANFPVFSELNISTPEYTAIPDKYIRTVVIPCAAFKYFIMDEEGSVTAPKYEEEFNKGLFYMERDYLQNIPVEYQADQRQGFVDGVGLEPRGLTIDGSNFYL